MKLSDVLKLPRAADRRAKLRQVSSGIFEKAAASIAEACKRSPIIGDGERQLNMRPTPSGLRDSLSENVLLALVTNTITVDAVLSALIHPVENGRPDSSATTGYVFGHPLTLTDALLTTLRARGVSGEFDASVPVAVTTHIPVSPTVTKTTITSGGTMTIHSTASLIETVHSTASLIETVKTCDLGHLINSWDKLAQEVPGCSSEVFESALTAAVESDSQATIRIKAIAAAVSSRVMGAPIKTDPHIPALVEAAVKNLLSRGYAASEETTPAEAPAPSGLKPLDPKQTVVVDAVLASVSLPSINDLINRLTKAEEAGSTLMRELGELRARPAASVTLMPVGHKITVSGSGKIPSGEVKTKPAYEVFGLKKGSSFDFEVPVWEWDAPHPYVPEVDNDYIFRPKELMAALYALITGERSWSSGHTGTGKTTLWEQIGARLNWPVRVLSFDSEITRADLIGQHVLVNDGGTTISKFVEGILPQCMGQPIMLVCDEVDFIRPDVAYVMQRVLEMKGLTLTEDGGRIVTPHPMFRIVATANTEGQGDDYGMYAGARVQSAAFLDRFTNWIRVDYLTAEQRLGLLKAKVVGLDEPTAQQVNKYTTEHIEAFKAAKVMKPISPRGMISLGSKVANYLTIFPSKSRKEAIHQALESCILNACTQQDRVVLKAIAARVFV